MVVVVVFVCACEYFADVNFIMHLIIKIETPWTVDDFFILVISTTAHICAYFVFRTCAIVCG